MKFSEKSQTELDEEFTDVMATEEFLISPERHIIDTWLYSNEFNIVREYPNSLEFLMAFKNPENNEAQAALNQANNLIKTAFETVNPEIEAIIRKYPRVFKDKFKLLGLKCDLCCLYPGVLGFNIWNDDDF